MKAEASAGTPGFFNSMTTSGRPLTKPTKSGPRHLRDRIAILIAKSLGKSFAFYDPSDVEV